MQATLQTSVTFRGVGLHTGRLTRMCVAPQPADTGIRFQRSDLTLQEPVLAQFGAVPQSRLCTKLRLPDGHEISTIEHIMAALSGSGIHNALITLDGPEVPILDGSAAPFVRAFLKAGIVHQDASIRALQILKPVRVSEGAAHAALLPAEGLEIDFTIAFDDAAIGQQRRVMTLANGRFVRELCDSRTFCRKADVDAMHAAGLALGGTFDNAVVVDGECVLSPGGLRHPDEAVRHKMLDALGDLALAGAPILGRYEAVRAGHMLTNQLLRTLFATPGAVRLIDCTPAQTARLPGAGVNPSDLADVA